MGKAGREPPKGSSALPGSSPNSVRAGCSLGHPLVRCSTTSDISPRLSSWDLSKTLRCSLWKNLLHRHQLACLLHGTAKLAPEESSLTLAKRTKHLLPERAHQEPNRFSVIISKISLSSKMLAEHPGFSVASKRMRAAWFQDSPATKQKHLWVC